jgi:hypothetical protein
MSTQEIVKLLNVRLALPVFIGIQLITNANLAILQTVKRIQQLTNAQHVPLDMLYMLTLMELVIVSQSIITQL